MSKEINKVIKWLGEIVWCNAHGVAWIESTIEKLKQIKEEQKQ